MSSFKNMMSETTARYNAQQETRQKRDWHLKRLGTRGDWRKVDDPERIQWRLENMSQEPMIGAPLAAPIMGDDIGALNVLERIIEESNILGASFLVRGVQAARAVGRIVIRSISDSIVGFGTGFLVSPRLLMTNNHVLEDSSSAGLSSVQFNYYETSPEKPTDPIEFRFEPGTFFETDSPLDFTLVAVSERDTSGEFSLNFGWNPLIRKSGKAIVGERVNIIQHPSGEPMRIVLHDNQIEDVFDNFLHYKADTQPGSSGAPVFNDQWQIAALHHSGVPKRDEDNRILLVSGVPWDGARTTIDQIDWEANEGIRISAIVDYLDKLNLGAAQQQLYEAVFSLPPESTLISMGGGRAGLTPEMDVLKAPAAGTVVEKDGSVSWYFRMNFGPVGAGVPGVGVTPSAPPGPPPGHPDESKDKARKIIEGATGTDPYYDAEADSLDRKVYYADLFDEEHEPEAFYNVVHDLIESTHTTRLSYKNARHEHLYAYLDHHENGKLRNIYSGTLLEPVEVLAQELAAMEAFQNELLALEAMESSLDEDEYLERIFALEAKMRFNCEHVVPQSWFAKKQPMKADLHHLFTCEWNCNSFRNNIAYFAFDPTEEKLMSDCGRVEHAENQFEPEFGRGAVARATLYFLARYRGVFVDHENLMPAERMHTLKLWHGTDPVSRYELHRNACIFKVQGNRNPFVDFPELVDQIDFSQGFTPKNE